MKTRTCLICNDPVTGRADKKYCSDQCRALANNEKKAKSQYTLHSTNKILRKNRTILKTLCPQGKATVRKEVLIDLGFQIDTFTSLYVTNSKQVYYICYDFAFLPLKEGNVEKVLIVSRQEYMKNLDPWRFLQK